ncbi:transcriptional regulator [Parvularcula sp. ZS-1/3]|uniref:Transcriptional regulator n=1 Tax=Parvularcula mediterranea TaxID=2732508 RepID=A0A7Y3W4I3_9PROT|nr:methanogen output domain 1-containing protein [Parvularcula mediterranea]NNU15785.1 transcriptional regulator [Parvularcula mediterranea]
MSATAIRDETSFADLPIERDRDQFLRELIRELSGVLERTVGLEDAEGFIAMVGDRLGHVMNDEYKAALGKETLSRREIAKALVDLKDRIKGGFSVERIEGDAIVLVNDRCPFGRYVHDRPSLCMMTSNVFGRIAAENESFAEVTITEAIARGDSRCRVVVSFGTSAEGNHESRSYYAAD